MEESSNGEWSAEQRRTYYDGSVPRLSLPMTTIIEGSLRLESSRYTGFSETYIAPSAASSYRGSNSPVHSAASSYRGSNSLFQNGHQNQLTEHQEEYEYDNEPDADINTDMSMAMAMAMQRDTEAEADGGNDTVQAPTAHVTNRVSLNNGVQGYAHNVVDATGVTIIQDDEEDAAKKRRYALRLGSVLCLVVALVIILPVSIVSSQQNTPFLVVTTLQPSVSPASVPTQAPTVTLISPALQETLSWLQYLDPEADWQDTTSPHYLAARWLADYDDATLEPASLQRYALTTFYFATTSPTVVAAVLGDEQLSVNDEDWKLCGALSSGCSHGALWLSRGVDECTWGYVTCESSSSSSNTTTTNTTSAPNAVEEDTPARTTGANTQNGTDTGTPVVTKISFRE
jgi:hypothetical protein